MASALCPGFWWGEQVGVQGCVSWEQMSDECGGIEYPGKVIWKGDGIRKTSLKVWSSKQRPEGRGTLGGCSRVEGG